MKHMAQQDVKDLENEEMEAKAAKQLKQEQDFWARPISASGDFLKASIVKEQEITHIKLIGYLGMKMTNFKGEDADNYERPNFEAVVVAGDKAKGGKYQVNFTRKQADDFSKAFGNSFSAWVGKVLTVSVIKRGEKDSIVYGIYKEIKM